MHHHLEGKQIKTKIAKRLLAQGHKNLDLAVDVLMKSISTQNDMKSRLRVIMEDWGFRLPMASAILTVLFPTAFTIYDVRVCEMLEKFEDAQYKKPFDKLWNCYEEYIKSVKKAVNENLSLRDKDRWLWGKSFALQLEKDIENKFERKADDLEVEA